MRVLIGCERSGTIRRAMRARGHDAWSCDLVDADHPLLEIADGGAHHLSDDVRHVLTREWDLAIFHPPCTYLCQMGIWWNHKRPERWALTYDALAFVETLAAAPIPRIAIENPIGYLNSHWRRPEQTIHPWQFGHEASKPTCLWLKNLPPLVPVAIVGKGRFYTKANGYRLAVWSHTTSGTRKAERARIAARTFQGIAAAMADQWGALNTWRSNGN